MIGRSLIRSCRPSFGNLVRTRGFHVSRTLRIVNPMLPFDLLEDLENDDLEEANDKLKKEKKKLIRQKKKIAKRVEKDSENGEEGGSSEKTAEQLNDDEFKTKNDTIPLKKALTTEVKSLDVKKDADANKGPSSDKANKSDQDNSPSEGSTPSESSKSNASTAQSNENGAVMGGAGGGNGGSPPDKPDNDDSVDKNDEKEAEKKKENDEVEKEVEEEVEEEEEEEEPEPSKLKETFDKFVRFLFKCLETIGITFSSVAMLGVAGILYHKYYGKHVLEKIDRAFDTGDPAYQLSVHKRTNKHSDEVADGHEDCDLSKFWAQRPQQSLLDDIISGKIVGRYFLVIGEKGTGKTSLLLEAMKKVDGHNVAIFDAHADPEIFRLRLGKALNYAYNEDYIGSLFSIRGPRDTTALLDIERAFGKLEELALKRISKTKGRPLVLIINNAHLIKDNEDGVKLIELLQQKAESLSGSGLATIIFNSDDYWVYEKLKKLGTRIEVVNVRDFGRKEAVLALKFTREKNFPSYKYPDYTLNDSVCNQIYDLIGGRPQHIAQVARHRDIFKACHEIIDREKTWFLNQCGLLGLEMDDDVMESGKFSTSAMLLMKEFVDMDRGRFNTLISQDHPDKKDELKDHHLPELPLWRSRQIMTRADYIQQYDNLNIFTIDSESRVRADSVPMMRAFHEIASQPHFDELLEDTIERVAQIESLGRTRELMMKDLMNGGRYQIKKHKDDHKFSFILDNKKKVEVSGNESENTEGGEDENDNDDDDLYMEDIEKAAHKKWWKKRMQSFDQSYSPPKTTEFDLDINRR
ncbi:hypothetical protein CLIB1423_23S00452 [[Candida] railenensis]|uniref:ATPase domain-containing protein n=1 Tax=[Candida] railenensis TaxID=45579 RepID=A0A9P0QUC7_9ASCO|nr:hypothetical protein CLIB1423_23S00452 [[Candida] railenensis]